MFLAEDALAMVVMRGKLFETLPEGAMLSVPLSKRATPVFKRRSLDCRNQSPGFLRGIRHSCRDRAVTSKHWHREIEATRVRINVAAHIRSSLSQFSMNLAIFYRPSNFMHRNPAHL
ncbi:MAG: hypothetical protein R3C26_19790 [Calditrichia bacterium]